MSYLKKENFSSKTIFQHLCDQMDKLASRQISIEEAQQQANLAKQANNLLSYELNRAKFVQKHGADHIRNIEDQK